MPSFSILSAFARPADRHVGFMNFNRRALAMGAICASALITGIYAMPASAEVIYEEVQVAELQEFEVSSVVATTVVERDSYGITEYSLVQWPVPATTTLSSYFGFRSCAGCSSDHLGIDLNPGNGFPIESIADGVVVVAQDDGGGLGTHIVVEHTVNGQIVRSLYAHMQYGSGTVAVGQAVSRGQTLGLVGSTGLSTGPHLHFGIQIDGVEIDPLPWLLTNANS